MSARWRLECRWRAGSVPDLHREVIARGLVATISDTTLWRWLDADAIRPWRHPSWLFPHDPDLAERAAPVLDNVTPWPSTSFSWKCCTLRPLYVVR